MIKNEDGQVCFVEYFVSLSCEVSQTQRLTKVLHDLTGKEVVIGENLCLVCTSILFLLQCAPDEDVDDDDS